MSNPNQNGVQFFEPNSTDQNEKAVERARKRNHIMYTSALYFSFIAIGLCYSIFNPTLVQLSTIFDTDLRHMSLIFPVRSFGATFGTLANGFLNQYFNRQILLFSCLFLKGLSIFLVPHWTTIEQFCVNGFFNGFFTAASVVMVNVWLNELWSCSARQRQLEEKMRKRNQNSTNHISEDDEIVIESTELFGSKIDLGNVLMQALHFFYGVGCILGPILSEPFLRNAFTDRDGYFLSNCLVLPYTIASLTSVLSALIFFILYMINPYEQPYTSKTVTEYENSDRVGLLENEEESNESANRVNRKFVRYLVVFTSVAFLFVFLCSEGTYFQFSASFATKTGLHMSEPDAALLASSLAISFTVFRALSVLIALKLTPGTMILLDLISVAAGNTLIYLFADRNLSLFVVGTVLLGAGFASVFPSFFPFLEQHGFPVTDMVGSLLTFSGGLAEILAPFVVGLYIDTEPYALVYFAFVSVALSFGCLIVLNAIIRWFAVPSFSSSNGLPNGTPNGTPNSTPNGAPNGISH